MPIVEVKLWAGRTREQKAELARRFTEAMVEVSAARPKPSASSLRTTPRATGPRAACSPTTGLLALRICDEGRGATTSSAATDHDRVVPAFLPSPRP
jgi:hypothetical protein